MRFRGGAALCTVLCTVAVVSSDDVSRFRSFDAMLEQKNVTVHPSIRLARHAERGLHLQVAAWKHLSEPDRYCNQVLLRRGNVSYSRWQHSGEISSRRWLKLTPALSGHAAWCAMTSTLWVILVYQEQWVTLVMGRLPLRQGVPRH